MFERTVDQFTNEQYFTCNPADLARTLVELLDPPAVGLEFVATLAEEIEWSTTGLIMGYPQTASGTEAAALLGVDIESVNAQEVRFTLIDA